MTVPSSSTTAREVYRHAHPVMGTVASIVIVGTADSALVEVRAVLDEAERIFSLFAPQSPLQAWRRGEVVDPSDEATIRAVLTRCEQLRRDSGGWFNPWAMPGGVDPGGFVKGWAGQEALAVIAAAGATGGFVGVGGDIATFGTAPDGDEWRIGITHPWIRDGLAGIVSVTGAIATSGNYARGGQLYDPRRGCLSEHVPSATVTGPDLGTCDALATALAVGGLGAADAVTEMDGYEYYLIEADGQEHTSAGLVLSDR